MHLNQVNSADLYSLQRTITKSRTKTTPKGFMIKVEPQALNNKELHEYLESGYM